MNYGKSGFKFAIRFYLVEGDVLTIVVGQIGTGDGCNGGGGGRVAGGGGSYNSGRNTSSNAGTNSNHGYVTIDKP